MTNNHLTKRTATTDIGQVPPQVLDMEEAVLGALLIEKPALEQVIDILHPDYFYKPAHQEIYQAVLTLFASNEPVDLLTVAQQLRKTEKLEMVGGPRYLMKLTNLVNSAANIEYHARVITEQAFKRYLIEMAYQIRKEAFEDSADVFELIDRHTRNILELSATGTRSRPVKGADIAYRLLKDLEEEMKNPQRIQHQSVFSGFFDLDWITGGLEATTLTIIAARPAMGKSAFALNLVLNAAQMFEKAAAFFSLEMSKEDVVYRLLSMLSGINTKAIKKRQLNNEQAKKLREAETTLNGLDIYVDSTPAITITELTAKLRRLVFSQNIKLVVIDYLQLMRVSEKPGSNREQEVAQITRSLKQLAGELSIPVIALSQINRSVESRSGDKRPQLSDLRESGELEQSADIVGFLYRAEYYGIMEDSVGQSTQGITELILAKHRDGETGTILLQFEPRFQRFQNLHENTFPKRLSNPALDGFTQNPDQDEKEGGEGDEGDHDPLELFTS